MSKAIALLLNFIVIIKINTILSHTNRKREREIHIHTRTYTHAQARTYTCVRTQLHVVTCIFIYLLWNQLLVTYPSNTFQRVSTGTFQFSSTITVPPMGDQQVWNSSSYYRLRSNHLHETLCFLLPKTYSKQNLFSRRQCFRNNRKQNQSIQSQSEQADSRKIVGHIIA